MDSFLKKVGRAASFGEEGEEALRELLTAASPRPPQQPAPSLDEATRRFKSEARALSAAISAGEADAATFDAALLETLGSWEQRLSTDPQDESGCSRTFMAFLQSQALNIVLESLVPSANGQTLFRDASAAIASTADHSDKDKSCEDQQQEEPQSGAGGALARLLLQASTASPALLGELLRLLVSAAEAADKCRSGNLAVHGVAADEDVCWVVRVIVATFMDSQEVASQAAASLGSDAEQALAAVKEKLLAKTKREPPQKVPRIRKLPVGTEVWACWPGNGSWYRAYVKGTALKRVQVTWLPRPHDGKQCDGEEYLQETSHETFVDLGRSAVLPVAVSRGRPSTTTANGLSNERWVERINAAEAHEMDFRELHGICARFEGQRRAKGSVSAATEQQRALDGQAAASTLQAFRTEAEERAEALSGVTSEVADEARSYHEEISTRSAAMELELQAVKVERAQATEKVNSARTRREELLEQLRLVSEELTAAEATCGSLAVREHRLYSSHAELAEELMRKFHEAREHTDVASQRHGVLTLTAGASRIVEEQLKARGAAVADTVQCSQGFNTQEQAVRAACVSSSRAQGRELSELMSIWHTFIWGPAAASLCRHPDQIAAVRSATVRALAVVDRTLQTADQMSVLDKSKNPAASLLEGIPGLSTSNLLETIFGHGESDDDSDEVRVAERMSRVAPKYRKMRQHLANNLKRLDELESCGRSQCEVHAAVAA